MARRKSKFLQDEDDSDDSDDSTRQDDQDDQFDHNDPDAAADRELFRNPYGRGKKRTREDIQEDVTYGVFAHTSDQGGSSHRGAGAGRGRGGRSTTDWTKAPAFVSSGAQTSKAPPAPLDNLSSALPIEAPGENEEDVAMELGSSDDEQAGKDEDAAMDEGNSDDDGDSAPAEDDEDDLAPVPGLARSPSPAPPPPAPEPELTGNSLGFAPRGLGSRGRGGIGSRGGGGIGARTGIGGGGARPASTSTAPPAFASATSASSMPLGGIGSFRPSASGADSPMAEAATPRAGLGAPRAAGGGIGSGGAGIGARPQQPSLVDSLRQQLATAAAVDSSPSATPSPADSRPQSPAPPPPPPSGDQPPRERRSFLPTASPIVPKKISKKEQQHFAQLEKSGSLGLKMLQKMGWKSGSGLGANEQGIVTPIGEGQKVRQKGAGIASGERSEGAKAEAARMRGEDPDEIEENEKKAKLAAKLARGKGGAAAGEPTKPSKDAWQQSKRKEPKIKTEYKTYEQILAEQGGEAEVGVGMLVDLSGNALPSQSLSSLPAFGAGSADPTRLPELRHNLTLLTSTLSSALSALAREGKGVEERRAYLIHEETRVRQAVEAQELAARRLQEVIGVVGKVKQIEREMNELLNAGGGELLGPKDLLSPFADEFDELFGRFPEEYVEMKLDEVIVGAIAPICRRLFLSWDPLTEPNFAVAELKRWRKHFLIDKDVVQQDGMDVDVFGSASYSNGGSSKKAADRSMTAYETMMWTLWLPKVRSAINNAWSPSHPIPAVTLFTAWSPLLPLFLRDNILDQLILPKLSKAIGDWSPSTVRRGGASLHTIVFPWLEHAGERMEQVLDEAKRKVRAWLKAWKVADGVPKGLEQWRDAFPSADWDTLVLKHVLPQLGSTLRERFVVNPRQQDLTPLEDVLAWAPLLRSSMMSQLIETGFVPKWLDALYVWLTSEPNLEQVAEWYSYWKSYFPESILALSGVSRGFRKGLDLMNQAMALGDDAKYRLKRPDTQPASSSRSSSSSTKPSSSRKPVAPPPSTALEPDEVSFRSVVEEVAAASNLVFLSTGKADEKGRALFRVSKGIDGKSGVTVYLEDDVVWLLEKGEFSPVGVDEMVKRALK